MDQTEFNPNNPGICHKLLISILPTDCPVCKGLAICSRLFNFSAGAISPSLATSTLIPRSFRTLLDHILLTLQRLNYYIVQILVAQETKPVTLGSFKDHSTIVEMSNFDASGVEHGIGTKNDQTVQLAPCQDPSLEKDYQPLVEESQAKEEDHYASMLTDLDSTYNYPGDERGFSQITGAIDDDVQEKVDKEEQEKEPTPSVTKKARAPKKMVSINENVEIFPISKTNKVMSQEWLSEFGNATEKSTPLKSILKVGSKLTTASNE